MPDRTALRLAAEALTHAPRQCRYHATNWDFLGRETPGGLPRCDSCKQPWRVQRALDAIDSESAGGTVLPAGTGGVAPPSGVGVPPDLADLGVSSAEAMDAAGDLASALRAAATRGGPLRYYPGLGMAPEGDGPAGAPAFLPADAVLLGGGATIRYYTVRQAGHQRAADMPTETIEITAGDRIERTPDGRLCHVRPGVFRRDLGSGVTDAGT